MQLSIIVPLYNNAEYLEEGLDSLIEALVPHSEIIIINDGSTDSGGCICNDYAQRHPQIRVITQENQGYGAACNKGLDAARGEYVAIFEPDDKVAPFFYKRLLKYAKSTKADMIKYNGYHQIKNGRALIRSVSYPYIGKAVSKEEAGLLWRAHPSIWNTLFKRQTLTNGKVRFTESPGASFQDQTFLISVFYTVKSIVIVSGTGYYYRFHPGQSIASADAKMLAIEQNWRQELNWLRKTMCPDLSYFMYNTFRAFCTLYRYRLSQKENKQQLLSLLLSLREETGITRLLYKDAKLSERFLFARLPAFKFWNRWLMLLKNPTIKFWRIPLTVYI